MNPSQLITLESHHGGGGGAFMVTVAPDWLVAPGSPGRIRANWQPGKFSNHWGFFFFFLNLKKKKKKPSFFKAAWCFQASDRALNKKASISHWTQTTVGVVQNISLKRGSVAVITLIKEARVTWKGAWGIWCPGARSGWAGKSLSTESGA